MRTSRRSSTPTALSILTCRPNAALSAAECDTVIADWITRSDGPG
jgi:hypothetical protein